MACPLDLLGEVRPYDRLCDHLRLLALLCGQVGQHVLVVACEVQGRLEVLCSCMAPCFGHRSRVSFLEGHHRTFLRVVCSRRGHRKGRSSRGLRMMAEHKGLDRKTAPLDVPHLRIGREASFLLFSYQLHLARPGPCGVSHGSHRCFLVGRQRMVLGPYPREGLDSQARVDRPKVQD